MPTLPSSFLDSVPTNFELYEKIGGTTENLLGFSFHILFLTWLDRSSKSKLKFLVPGKYFILGHAGRTVAFIFFENHVSDSFSS